MRLSNALLILAATMVFVLTACGKKSDPPATTACSAVDLNEQQVTWPDGVSRKSSVYHCRVNGVSKDFIVDVANSNDYFWR